MAGSYGGASSDRDTGSLQVEFDIDKYNAAVSNLRAAQDAASRRLEDEALMRIKASLVPGEDKFERDVYMLTDGAAAVLVRKHRDYGPKNISQSPGGPLNGLRVRMWDKLARINNLVESGATPENESLRDSFLDLANYSLIACMVLDGTWPSE